MIQEHTVHLSDDIINDLLKYGWDAYHSQEDVYLDQWSGFAYICALDATYPE